MAEVATPGKKTAAKKPAKKPAPKPSKKPALAKAEAPVDDGGLREDDRARLGHRMAPGPFQRAQEVFAIASRQVPDRSA